MARIILRERNTALDKDVLVLVLEPRASCVEVTRPLRAIRDSDPSYDLKRKAAADMGL